MIKKIINILLVLIILLQSLNSVVIVSSAQTSKNNISVSEKLKTKYTFEITQQPNSVAVSNGSRASVSVNAIGEGLKYKWYYKDIKSKKFISSPLYKTNTYSVTMSDSRNDRKVYCVITDKYGKKLKTDTVALKNAVDIRVTKTRKTLTYISGEVAILSAKTNLKGELKYQWYFADKGAKAFEKAAAKTQIYKITMNMARDYRKVYCVVKNEKGERVKTQVVTLNAIKKLKVTRQPQDAIVPEGKTANISVKVSGEKGLKYQWYIKNIDDKTFGKSSVKTATYSTVSNGSSDGRKVYCVITDKYGQKVKTKTVSIKTSDVIRINKKSKNIDVFNGKKATVTVKTNLKGELKYQWYFANKGSKTFKKSSVKGATYEFKMNNTRDGRKIYCIVKDSNGKRYKSQIVTLNTINKLKITSQPKSVMVSEGKYVDISFKVSGGKGIKYQWYIKGTGDKKFRKSSVKSANYSTISNKYSDGRKVYCVITDKYGQKVKTKTVTIKMSDVVRIDKRSKTINVISGKNAIVTVKTNLKGKLKYQWYFAQSGSNVFKKSIVKGKTYSTVMDNDRDGRKIYCIVTDSKGKKYKSQVATLNIVKRLKITSQPKNIVVSKDKVGKVSFKVSGEKGLKYEWYVRDRDSSRFYKSSVKTQVYSAKIDEFSNGRKIYCVVSDKYGQQVKTKTIYIEMSEALIVSKTLKKIMVHESENAIVTANVSGKGKLKYQWYLANPKSNKFYKSSNKSKTYEAAMNKARDGMKIYCIVTDKNGKVFKTQTAVIYLIKKLKITKQPEDVIASIGTEVNVSFSVFGEKELKYQWYSRNKGSDDFKKTSCTKLKYSAKMYNAFDGREMYCEVTDNYGQKVITDIISFKKIEGLSITKQPQGDLVMNGETITLKVAAKGEGKLHYSWVYAEEGSSKYNRTSVTDSTYKVVMDSQKDNRRVCCIVTDNYGQKVRSDIVTISSYKKLKITKQPKDVISMSGKVAKTKVYVSGEEDLTYTWYIRNNGDDKFYKSTATSEEYSLKVTKENSGRQAYCVITDNHGQKVTTDIVKFEKDPNALHILIIGNSHSLDAFWFLREAYLDQNPNTDLCVGILYSSNGSIAGHAKISSNNEATNRYYRNNGRWNIKYDISHKDVLEDQEWDIIFMQPGKKDITTNTVNKVSRDQLAEYIAKYVKNPYKLMWNVTWPCPNDETFFSPDYIRQPPDGYKQRLIKLYDFNPINQYTEKIEKTKNVIFKEDLYSNHICSGAAVMHALYLQGVSQLELYRDYTHLSDYGRLLVAYSVTAQLTGKPIKNVGIDVITKDSRFHLFKHLGDINLTKKQKNVIIKASNYALENPWFIPKDK